MPIQKLPVQNLDDINHRRRARETINKVLDHTFDDSRVQTDAEKASGITPVNPAFEPGQWTRTGADAVNDAALNTPAINKAFLPNSKTYEVIGGTYSINDNLNAQDNQTIEMSKGVTVKPTAWADTGIIDSGIIDIDSKADVGVVGGILDGNKATLPTGRIFGVRVQDSADVTINGTKIVDCPGSNAAGTLGGDGVYVAGTSLRFQAIGVTCTGNVRNNIAIVQCDGWNIIGGFSDGATGTFPGAGVDVESDSASNPIYDGALIGHAMRSNYRALQITVGTSGIEAMGCSLRGSRAGDLTIANCDTVGFIGNHIRSTPTVASSAIVQDVVNTDRIRFIGNDLFGSSDSNETYGIYVSNGVRWMVISGNIISDTESFAIRLGNDSMEDDIYGVIITGNIFLNCGDPAANVPVIFIGANSGGTVYPRYVVVRGNACIDERSGGDAATAFLQISSLVPDSAIAQYDIGDNLIIGTQARYLNCPNEGTFTGTLTGCTTSPTGSILYSQGGEKEVVLQLPAITGTSNTTAATITGMPSYLHPASTQTVLLVTQDNGTEKLSRATISTSGVITLENALTATFTNSGTKGVSATTVPYRRAT